MKRLIAVYTLQKKCFPLLFRFLGECKCNAKSKKNTIPPTMSNVPVIQKLAYIHKIRMAKRPTIKSPGVYPKYWTATPATP